MTKCLKIGTLLFVLDKKSDSRLLGKIVSLTGVFVFRKKEALHMIVKDVRGNELLEVIDVPEEQAEDLYNPVNHCLAVAKVGNEYLMGWNHWRKIGRSLRDNITGRRIG